MLKLIKSKQLLQIMVACISPPFVFVFLAALVFIVYSSGLGNDFISDDLSIAQNPYLGSIKSITTQLHLFFQPLLYLILYKTVGLNPFFYRLVNVLFHAGTVLLVYKLILNIFKKPNLAFLTAVLFAVHPILSESVTWISGGNYVRYTFFFLLSFLSYIRSERYGKFYFLSLFFFFLSLFCSYMALATPFIFILYEFLFGNLKKRYLQLSVFVGIAFFWSFTYVNLLGSRISSLHNQFYETATFQNPLIIVPTAVTNYIQLIFWPDQLTLYHTELNYGPVELFIRFILTVILLGFFLVSIKKNKLIAFGLGIFFIALSPTVTPFMIAWNVAERYAYLSTLGILLIIAYGISLVASRLNKTNKAIFFVIVGFVMLLLSVRTIFRNHAWLNQDTLWIATDRTSPSSHNNHNNLGDMYDRHGDYEQAVVEFQKAIALKPNYADAYHNLGNTYVNMGKLKEAAEAFSRAYQLNPNLWQSLEGLSAIYYENKKYKEAEDFAKRAIAVNPNEASLYSNLGIIYMTLKDKNQAISAFQQALTLNPQDQKALDGLSQAQSLR